MLYITYTIVLPPIGSRMLRQYSHGVYAMRSVDVLHNVALSGVFGMVSKQRTV